LSLPSRVGDFVRSLSRLQRELAVLGIAVILGFLVMPALTWLVGMIVFKTYAGGNTVFSMYGNFYQAIAKGAPVFWIVALGPYALILVARLLVFVFRGGSGEEAPVERPAQPRRRAPQASDERRAAPPADTRRAPPAGRREPSLNVKDDARRPATQPSRAPAPPRESAPSPDRAPQPNRAPPAAPQPARKAPPKPGERRTPFIKSID
jgi:hypothetical protein